MMMILLFLCVEKIHILKFNPNCPEWRTHEKRRINSDRFRIFNIKTHVLHLYHVLHDQRTSHYVIKSINDPHDAVYGSDDSHELKQKPSKCIYKKWIAKKKIREQQPQQHWPQNVWLCSVETLVKLNWRT